LIEKLAGVSPAVVYLVGASREVPDADRIVTATGASGSVINICGKTSLLQLATLLKSVDLFIGNSSGTAHLSALSGTPTLTLQSATNHSHQWGPIGVNAFCMSLDVPCGRCHILDLSQCSHGFRCMLDMTPDMVFRQAMRMLSTRGTAHPHHKTIAEKQKHVELLG
jgi:ADP-heptose:LPS heptosyltransferase